MKCLAVLELIARLTQHSQAVSGPGFEPGSSTPRGRATSPLAATEQRIKQVPEAGFESAPSPGSYPGASAARYTGSRNPVTLFGLLGHGPGQFQWTTRIVHLRLGSRSGALLAHAIFTQWVGILQDLPLSGDRRVRLPPLCARLDLNQRSPPYQGGAFTGLGHEHIVFVVRMSGDPRPTTRKGEVTASVTDFPIYGSLRLGHGVPPPACRTGPRYDRHPHPSVSGVVVTPYMVKKDSTTT